YWYRITRWLADQCEVMSWIHHYRTHNKMADAIANMAMDQGSSVMCAWPAEGTKASELESRVMEYIERDTGRWASQQIGT
ncbi:hypothetical protein PHMEG_00039433, partial [Phytophthora megakarya]